MLGFSSYILNQVGVDAPQFDYENMVINFFANQVAEVTPSANSINMSIRAVADEMYIGLTPTVTANDAPWALSRNAMLSLPLNPVSGQKYYLLSPNDGAAVVVFQRRI